MDQLDNVFRRAPGTRLMAAINASPESFHSASVADLAGIGAAARRAAADGAALIDVGAMSTAPYLEARVSEAEELERMVPAIAAVRAAVSVPVSADTARASVAAAALDAGACIVNDVSGLGDPAMAPLIARRGAGVVLMANESPNLSEGVESPARLVAHILRDAVAKARAAGIREDRIMIDPGIGFFRHRSIPWHAWDMEMLRNLEEFTALGYPVLAGASRKSFIGHYLGRKDPADRLAGSLAVAIHCAARGVEWLRVHDVAATRDALAMAALL